MDLKKIIKEEVHIAMGTIKNILNKDKEFNEDYYENVGKKFEEYYKDLKDDSKELDNKYEMTDEEKEIHDLYEIRNGLEMIEYDNEPSEKFKERAKEAIVGSSKMGNPKETGGKGFKPSSVDENEKIFKDALKSKKKRDEAKLNYISMGDDIEMINGGKGRKNKRKLAFESEEYEEKLKGGYADNMTPEDIAEKHGVDVDKIYKQLEKGIKIEMEHTNSKDVAREIALDHLFENPDYYDDLERIENEEETEEIVVENKNVFYSKEKFNSFEDALNLITEDKKVDGNKVVVTDGNEKYEILFKDGEPIVENYENKKMLEESINKINKLYNFDQFKEFAGLNGNERKSEDDKFSDILKKMKNLAEK
jgi:hypothetical protein